MINLHDLYLNTIEVVLASYKLEVVQQPEGQKPAGVLWCVPKGSTKPEAFIAYAFDQTGVNFEVVSRDMNRNYPYRVAYVEGVEGFLTELVKFLGAGRLAAPKGRA